MGGARRHHLRSASTETFYRRPPDPSGTGRDTLSKPLFGAFSTPEDNVHRLGPMQTIEVPQRRFKEDEVVDYVVVGVGSAGGVLLQRLARAGFTAIGLEAGPFWDTERDWVSD